MYSKQLLSAATALAMATGVLSIGCTDPTATISSAADATQLASCSSVPGSVVIAAGSGSTIDLSGQLATIGGNFIVNDNGGLVSLTSTSLKQIGGTWQMHNVTLLSTLRMDVLSKVGSIDWRTLNALGSLTFTTGISSASSVTIADTFLNTLDGINVVSLSTMDINNNKRLVDFSSKLANISDTLTINANGLNLTVKLPNLVWAANFAISNVTSFSAPSLSTVNESMRFESNYFATFSAPNLTQIQKDLSFVSCPGLMSIMCPSLTTVGGGFTIANNTNLSTIAGFGSLQQVGGAVALRGSFSNVSLPSLNDVKGAFDVTSTQDISASCKLFDALSPNGGNGKIQGAYSCSSDNANANNNTVGGGTTSGGNSSTSSGTGNTKNAASGQIISLSTVFSLASLGALFVAFL